MKILKLFALFMVLHASGWLAAHFYMENNPRQILLVVDTSYAMKPKFPAVEQWIKQFRKSARYQTVQIGTDKAMLGQLDDLKSPTVIFRTAFGRMNLDHLQLYQQVETDKKILLSDGSLKPDGWRVVVF